MTVVSGGTPLWRRIVAWLLGILLALDVIAVIFAVSVFQVTSEAEAKLALRHAVAGLTEIDAFLDEQYPALREEAATADGPLSMPGFPIDIRFTAEEVTDSTQAAFRVLLLDRSVERVYVEGLGAFSQEPSLDDGGILTTQRALSESLDVFGEDAHTSALVTLVVTLGIAAVLVVALAFATPRGAMLGCGVALLVGAGLALVGSGGLFAVIDAADADDYLAEQLTELVRGLVWAPVRTSAVLFGLGVIVTFTGAIVARRWPLTAPTRAAV